MSDVNLEVKVAVFEERLAKLTEEFEEVKKDNLELKAMASRWKGFGAALIALGGGASFIATQYDHLKILLGFVAKAHGQ